MLSKEIKIKLILLFKKNIITKNQLQSVIKIGYPAPVIMETPEISEREKEILKLGLIYRMLGQKIIGITFEK
jgi:hypothetical protein